MPTLITMALPRHTDEIRIEPFSEEWQVSARALILEGMKEHWGTLDPTQNPDLSDIAGHYADGVFLIALSGEELIGTAALVPEGEGVMRIVRMSVARNLRRKGIASSILNALLERARECGCHRVVCETTDTWEDAIGFYRKHGFEITGRQNGEVHFARDIE